MTGTPTVRYKKRRSQLEQLIKYLFIAGLVILVSAAIMWQSITGVILWRVAISFLVISIGVKLLWLKE